MQITDASKHCENCTSFVTESQLPVVATVATFSAVLAGFVHCKLLNLLKTGSSISLAKVEVAGSNPVSRS